MCGLYRRSYHIGPAWASRRSALTALAIYQRKMNNCKLDIKIKCHCRLESKYTSGYAVIAHKPHRCMFLFLHKKWIIYMVGVIDPISYCFFTTYICAVIPAAFDFCAGCSISANHRNFLRRSSLWYKNLTINSSPCAVGSHRITCIPAAILYDPFHTNGFAVCHQYCCSPVLK